MDCSRKLILSRNFPRGHSQKFIPKISRFFSLAKVPFTLFFKTLSANSTKVSVVTSLFSLLSKCFLIEARPSLCWILRRRSTTSIVLRTAFFVKPPHLSFLRMQMIIWKLRNVFGAVATIRNYWSTTNIM